MASRHTKAKAPTTEATLTGAAETAEADANGATEAPAEKSAEEVAEEPEKSAEETAAEEAPAAPTVHLPNLVAVEYFGEEPWVLREAITMPYPVIRAGDVVVVDAATAKWLTRKGMAFRLFEGALAKGA